MTNRASAQNVLVIGATSAIAQATAKEFAKGGASFCLVGRQREKLDAVAGDLSVRGGGRVECIVADLDELTRHATWVAEAYAAFGRFDVAILAHGTLPDQAECEQRVELALAQITTNFVGVASLLTLLAGRFEEQGAGCIAVIGSVAGDRGRRSNYVYGSAKGAVALFLQGLRARLDRRGVAVLTVKPGFVDTPMTAHLAKNPLYASPERVGRAIHLAIGRRRDVLYVPWFWKWIMLVIRLIPERLFKRMPL